VFLDFYVAALCNLAFMICGSYIEHVWPPLLYNNVVRSSKNKMVSYAMMRTFLAAGGCTWQMVDFIF